MNLAAIIRPAHRAFMMAITALLLLAQPGVAQEQKFTVNENALVRFKASITGITRISVRGDRILRLINDDQKSLYQSQNDEHTGDIFLRYVGQDQIPPNEAGYLITEKGQTIAYEIAPVRSGTQTVLITLRNTVTPANVAPSAAGFAGPASIESSDSFVSRLTAMTRETILHTIRTAAPKSGRNGALHATHSSGDLVGELRVAATWGDARFVREQEFYRPGVLAVWIQKKSLTAGERGWVVVVRRKS